jgi:hypothetical protein
MSNDQRSDDVQPGPGAHLSTTEARQGVTLGTMRYVLGVSVVLAIVALIAVFKLV